MKKLKKISAVLMAMVLAFGLFALMPTAMASAAEFTVNNETELTDALASADTEIVINIGASIQTQFYSPIRLSGKIVTINLQGNDITGYSPLHLYGSSLTIKGPGTIHSSVAAYSGSNTLTITDGAIFDSGVIVWDEQNSGTTVLNVTGNVLFVDAGEGGIVNVTGNALSGVSTSGGTANITGNVSGYGIDTTYSGHVTVGGSVSSSGRGVAAGFGSTVTVNGTITAATEYITFHNMISGTAVPSSIATISDITTPTTKAGYFTYTDGENTVWVRDNAAAGNPYILAASPAWTGSGAAAWRIASEQFIALYRNSELVDPGNYETAAGSTIITLKESYIKTLGNGTHTFTAEFADIGNVNLVLTVSTGGGQLDSVPKTGEAMEESTATALLLIALVALVTAAAVAIITYKKKHAAK